MLPIMNLEEIQGMLRQISDLVNLQEQRDVNFGLVVLKWFSELEKILKNNHMSIAGNIATLRGMILSANRGVIPSEIAFHGQCTIQKIREATAAFALRKACDLISDVIQRDINRVTDAEHIARQLIVLAKSKGLIEELPHGRNYTDMLKAMWKTFSNDPDLSPAITNIEGLVRTNDALIILDRTITSDIPVDSTKKSLEK